MEKAFIRWLNKLPLSHGFERIGIGDDCAVLRAPNEDLVVTTDSICDGTHFRSTELTPEQIGRKALAVNLSDLAAMGALPRTALVSFMLPKSATLEYAKRLFQGIRDLAEEFQLGICGGDTNTWSGPLVVSVTAIGVVGPQGVWTMTNAKPGDQIVVTGCYGGSLLRRHWGFEPRVRFAVDSQERPNPIHACTDCSDSLGLDLAALAAASEVGFELDLDAIPISPDAVKLAQTSGKTALQHALTDGEDFELILAVDPQGLADLMSAHSAKTPLTRIGAFTESLEMVAIQGNQRSVFQPAGFEHKVDEIE